MPPRAASYLLTWSWEQERYLLFARDQQDRSLLSGDDPAWFAWLTNHSAFSFQGKQGHLNVLKEMRARGEDGYWYAYHRQGGQIRKRYVGRSASLTMTHLESVAQALGAPGRQVSASQEEHLPPPTPEGVALPTGNTTQEQGQYQQMDVSALATLPELQTSLLWSKLRPPRLPSSLLSRQRLLDRLDTGLEHKFTLLSAPAGFGKTTLVRQWIDERRKQSLPVAWVSLDPGDDNPIRFWRYIFTACQSFQSSPGQAALAQLSAIHLPFSLSALKAVLTSFLNDLEQLAEKRVLIVEDYHVITSPQIHASFAFVLDHLPATVHLTLITRSDPPLPLARWRAKYEVQEIDAADLRFSPDEVAIFLQRAFPFQLSSEIVSRLETQVEGWVTGLRLLTLALQGRTPQEIERLLATFVGSHHYLLDYFSAEVLSTQTETLQAFLLHTSGLSRLTPSLCDAVTGRNDSDHLLEVVERAGLFLQRLDGTEPWYRYHSLFAEALQAEARRRLGDAFLRGCLSRASVWYEQHGMFAEAVEAALQAREWMRAATLITPQTEMRPSTELQDLARLTHWLEQLPHPVLATYPSLCLAYATALLFTLDRSAPATMARIQPLLQIAEQTFQSEGNRAKLGELLAFRAQVAGWQGDLPQAILYARQALELPPGQELLWHSSSIITTSLESLAAGKPDAARQAALEARAQFAAAGIAYGVRAATFILADAHVQQGELHQAASLYRQLLAESREDPLDRATALVGLAQLSYEWNDLVTAAQQVAEALDLGRHHGEELGIYYTELTLCVPASIVQARILSAAGNTLQAQHVLQDLALLTQERRWLHLQREVFVVQAQLCMAAHDLDAVKRWLAACTQLGKEFRVVQQEREALLLARLLIAQEEAESALQVLTHWQTQAHTERRTRSELEIRVLMALAYAALQQQPQAKQHLKEVLLVSQEAGYQRFFLDQGETLAGLLRSLLVDLRGAPPATYARNVLLGFASPQADQPSSPATTSALLLEPLTTQEQRVLRLLAAGRSNPEIAEALVVSVNTVKTQVQSIYRKLSVSNRAEARSAALQMRLL